MSLAKFFLVICLVSLASSANWAVLIAGSNGWYNYRHQADVFHAYQVITEKGVKPKNIITFAYDDIASYSRNPFPGKVFNKPTYDDEGVDVYEGVQIDYRGGDVTPENFLAVLEGNKSSLNGVGSGRVLETDQNDNIFIFFSDHGAPNLIAFPSKYLYANSLMETFSRMTAKNKYKKLVFYLESCESGSMFVNLPTDTAIYGLSAANPTQSSWGYYCSPDDVIQGRHIGSCLGDLFSISFIENWEASDLTGKTWQVDFEEVKARTTKSHVMQWGDQSYTSEKISSVVGPKTQLINLRKTIPRLFKGTQHREAAGVDGRYAKIKILIDIFKREHSVEAQREMMEEMKDMQRHDKIFHHLQEKLDLSGAYSPQNMNYDCMRALMDNHTEQCGRLSDYGLMYAKYYAEACEKYQTETIINHVQC